MQQLICLINYTHTACKNHTSLSKDVEMNEQVEAQAGGTRWNPTQEQIKILEMLYSGGMRTPNAQQIEQITVQLAKYGKIEGKNVFYWFQNHKARERQKQKRNSTALNSTPNISVPSSPFTTTATSCLLLSPVSSSISSHFHNRERLD